jgi:hypothetical protein
LCPVPAMLRANRMLSPCYTFIILAKREANAKSLLCQTTVTEKKQHVEHHMQSVTDNPFLNRVSQVRILPGARCEGHVQHLHKRTGIA